MKESPALPSQVIPIPALEGYRLWSRTYDTDPNPLLALEFRILARRLGTLAGRFLVDAGCGTGRWMAYAASRHAGTAGVDLCPEMLRVAGGKALLGGTTAVADCRDLPFRDAVADIGICSFTIGYMSNPCRAVRELARVTRPGGSVFVTDLHPRARAQGWHRAFRDGERVYALEDHPTNIKELVDCGESADMRLRDVREPHLGEPELAILRRAGKADRFEEIASVPAIFCLEWRKA